MSDGELRANQILSPCEGGYDEESTVVINPQAIFDASAYRKTLGRFPTGVAIITAVDGSNNLVGMTVNSFASVSLTPPIILWSVARTTPSYLSFTRARFFIVNILSEDQEDISYKFSRPSQDKFSGVQWRPGINGAPLIEGCVAHLECSLNDCIGVGDHDIILGNVERFACTEKLPLAFALNGYKRVV